MLLRPGVNGGMYKSKCLRANPLTTSQLNTSAEFLDKIVKLGGKITQPKQEVPEVGWIAAAEDPEGNAFALLQPIRV